MSEIKDTGGAAFPMPEVRRNEFGVSFYSSACYGMTLRDYFAAQALAAIIQADGAQFFASNDAHAMIAYEHADAMIAYRKDDADSTLGTLGETAE